MHSHQTISTSHMYNFDKFSLGPNHSYFARGIYLIDKTENTPCAILEWSDTILELRKQVGILTLRRAILEWYRFLLCAEHIYIIFYQSLLRQALECVQSRQSVDYSRPCTKWANIWHFLDKPYHACILVRAFTALTHVQKWVCIWHILSVNAQTRLSMRSVSPEQSLLLALAQNGCTCGIFFQ